MEYSHSMAVGTLRGVGIYIWHFNSVMVFEFLIFVGIELNSFAHDTETVVCAMALIR